jgi:DNA-binding beta-propeller fold protein YncE
MRILLLLAVFTVGCSDDKKASVADLAGAPDLADVGGAPDLTAATDDLASAGTDGGSDGPGYDLLPAVIQLKFVAQPTSTPTAVRVAPAVTVKLTDGIGNLVAANGTAVTLALVGGTAGAMLGGTKTAMSAAGVATFADLSVDKAGAGYTLTASASGLAGDTSAAFDVGTARAAVDGLGHLDATTMNFTRTTENDGPSASSLNRPNAVVLDSMNHRLFVADLSNGRVLIYPLSTSNDLMGAGGSRAATIVLGQSSFRAPRTTTIAANTIPDPVGLAYDATNNRLFVTDSGTQLHQDRVLVFNLGGAASGMSASYVIGQSSFTATGSASTQSGLKNPVGIATDGNRLFVADSGNNRVLVFNVAPASLMANGPMAANVLGQGGYATTAAATSSTGMSTPNAVAWDGGRLFVADQQNHRVLVFNSGSISDGHAADNELGQAAGGTAFTTKVAAITQGGLNAPTSVACDGATRLFVGDSSNDRLLVFDTTSISDGENAVHVLGQADFTSNTTPTTLSATVLRSVNGAAASGTQLFVADRTGHRVLLWSGTISDGGGASDGLGHVATGAMDFAAKNGNDDPSGSAFDKPSGMALDGVNHRLYVAEELNHRVLVFPLSANNDLVGTNRAATIVLGHAQLGASSIPATPTAGSMNGPTHVAVDTAHNRLFVADTGNHRVLVFGTNTLASGNTAVHVLGQGGFGTNGYDLMPNTMRSPDGLAYDAANDRLFVSDRDNNRVLVFNTATINDGMAAAHVLGEPDLMTNAPTVNPSRNFVDAPTGLAWDAAGGRLFVAEQGLTQGKDHRVLVFNAAPAALMDGMDAANVIGQASFTATSNAVSQTTLCTPNALAFDDARNRLYVSDECHWVAAYDTSAVADGMKAFDIFGQSDFVTKAAAPPTAAGIGATRGLAVDGAHATLFVGDVDLHRVLMFNAR